MLELRRRLDLLNEPVRAEHGGQFGAQHLERDCSVELQVRGEIDGRHAARAKSAFEAVAVGKCSGEMLGVLRHAPRRAVWFTARRPRLCLVMG